MAQVRLIDIAKKAGVSHATVSRVINGKQSASSETGQLILDVARELGYRPNHSARMLVSKREGDSSVLIELVFCGLLRENEHVPGGFQMQVVRGIQEVALSQENVDCHLSYLQDDWGSEDLQRLERANGVILLGNSSRQMVEELLVRNVKVVLADHQHEGLEVHSVLSDDIIGGMLAAMYLVERGFTRLGWLGGEPDCFSYKRRLDGVRLQLSKMGLTLRSEDIRFAGRATPEDFERTMNQWLDEGDVPPAIITPTSLSVQMVQHALARHGMQMPRDMSLVSFDDDVFSLMCRPVPTRIATDPLEIGRAAMQGVLQIVRHPDQHYAARKTIVPVKLIEGDSVKQPA